MNKKTWVIFIILGSISAVILPLSLLNEPYETGMNALSDETIIRLKIEIEEIIKARKLLEFYDPNEPEWKKFSQDCPCGAHLSGPYKGDEYKFVCYKCKREYAYAWNGFDSYCELESRIAALEERFEITGWDPNEIIYTSITIDPNTFLNAAAEVKE